jgi:hypothetical protein
MSVTVRDPVEALDTLERLLGKAGSDAFEHALGLVPDDENHVELATTTTPTAVAAGLCRLALANWYSQWTPLPIPLSEARLDVGTAAFAAHRYEKAAEAFSDAGPVLTRLVAELQDRGGAPPALVDALASAIHAAVGTLGPKHPDNVTLSACEREIQKLSTREDGRMWGEGFAGLRESGPRLALRTRPGAGDPDQSGQHSCGVDWSLVDPRVLDTSETAITWTAKDGLLDVIVAPHPLLDPTSPEVDGLLARVVNEATGEVLGVDVLVLDPEWTPALAGGGKPIPVFRSTHMPSPLGGGITDREIRVEAFSTWALAPASASRQARAARAQRDAVRSLACTRLAAADVAFRGTTSRPPDTWEASHYAQLAAEQFAQSRGASGTVDQPAGHAVDLMMRWLNSIEQAGPTAALVDDAHAVGVRVPRAEVVSAPLLCEMLHIFRRTPSQQA